MREQGWGIVFFLVTLAVACAGAWIGKRVKIPAGAMLGAMAGVAVFHILTGRGRFPSELKTVVQILSGALIGSKVSRKDVAALKKILLPTAILLLFMTLMNLTLGISIYKLGGLDIATALFSASPGGLTDMALLAEELGATLRVVDIGAAVRQHFADIGQSMDDHSVTFENGQARERTQVLMDIANKAGGLVIGTGDLSELALGWATYNGDHMSMYGVNASIPKTLVRHLVAFVADDRGGRLAEVLRDILDTPVSPELLPPKDGEIAQRTEDLVGPYELHDFFLYYAVRWGFPPRKVLRLAERAMGGRYGRAELLRWLRSFYRRFFAQQFKRSCLPDGPKVGTLTLSPRGDWRMPSDAVARLWLDQLEGLE